LKDAQQYFALIAVVILRAAALFCPAQRRGPRASGKSHIKDDPAFIDLPVSPT
jgi:hypothetical protein